MTGPLWRPSAERLAQAQITRFMQGIEARHGLSLPDFSALHHWSVTQPEAFWAEVWDFAGIIASNRGEAVIQDPERMPGAAFFPEARLNFAENLLRRKDAEPALVFWGEEVVQRHLSHGELYETVARLAQALKAAGVTAGDRIAGFLPNLPEAVMAMLAASSLGAVWSSCSPDFGVQGVLDRFGQIEPRILFTADAYRYQGKVHDCLDRVAQIAARLPSVERVVVIPSAAEPPDLRDLPQAISWAAFLAPHAGGEITFAQLPFNHPLYIMYSSGTTGVPKCIVHGAGGTLLKQLSEHLLHTDVRPGDRLFYFTTCGWMMWNWLVAALAAGATLMLFDGSPFHPSPAILFDYIDAEGITLFGTSAKFIDAVAKTGWKPAQTHRLDTLRTILSTGSPLAPESFDFVYRDLKGDVCLSSISGGTDILGCFALGNPALPVWRGELQCQALGLRVEVFDEQGQPLRRGKGELVCTAPFPSMPIGFWNDADGAKYHAAYFARFPGVWCHGDWVEWTEHGGLVIHGRSDAVLNPGGVRIGTAEIYRQVEALDEVIESVVIGQDWQGDVRIVLFVRLREGVVLDAALQERIRRQIREHTTPRHVPAKILAVSDIPRTRSGKIVELAVRHVVHGRPVQNREALANPEALDLFRNLADLGT
jgi:acetoacetyl-CoA synthetase